jgi:hypothetical protein
MQANGNKNQDVICIHCKEKFSENTSDKEMPFLHISKCE